MTDPMEQMWDRYSHRLGSFIRGRVEEDAEDILQEVFIRIHRNLCCQEDWNKPEAWVYQIARNLIIDHYRRRRELMEIPESLPAEPDLPEDDPEAVLALDLKEMIDELPEHYRQALILTEYQGMSQGAVLVFLIAGSGTSIGAITGALMVALVVGVLWLGAILSGFAFDLYLSM
jgi:RNA polymerase sigma-70 factor (ECF subfamily)